MKILLNIIGVIIFFLNRFAGRKDKSSPVSARFWIQDNWEQLTCAILFDVALMILVIHGGLEFNFETLTPMLPEGVRLAGDLALSFLTGLIFSWVTYVGYKKLAQKK